MTVTTFSIRGSVSPLYQEYHIAPEYAELWSVIETDTIESPGAITVSEIEIACSLNLADAFTTLMGVLQAHVAPKANAPKVANAPKPTNATYTIPIVG